MEPVHLERTKKKNPQKYILQLHLFEQIMLNLIILTDKACHFYQGVFEKRKSQKDPVVLNDFIW